MIYADETTADAMQAWHEERMNADAEQAAMERVGDLIWSKRKQGKCMHQSSVAYRSEPYYPEQLGLLPGQSRCTEGCLKVFDCDQDWYDAMDEAIYG